MQSIEFQAESILDYSPLQKSYKEPAIKHDQYIQEDRHFQI